MIELLIILAVITIVWVYISSKYLIIEYNADFTISRVTPHLPAFNLPSGSDPVNYYKRDTENKYGYYPNYQSFDNSDNYSVISGNYKLPYQIISDKPDLNCLVIGLMVITSSGYLHNTLTSLRNTGYNGKIVVFVDKVYEKIEDNIYNATIIRLRRKYPYYPYNCSTYYINETDIIEMIPEFPRSHK